MMNTTYILDTLALKYHIRRKVLLQTFLIRYLKGYDLYVGFRNNIINHSFRKLEFISDIFNAHEYPSEVIDKAFIWGKTQEGDRVWQIAYEDINSWWERLLKTICDSLSIQDKKLPNNDRGWFIY